MGQNAFFMTRDRFLPPVVKLALRLPWCTPQQSWKFCSLVENQVCDFFHYPSALAPDYLNLASPLASTVCLNTLTEESSPKKFAQYPSHRIFEHTHRALNAAEKITNYAV